MGKGERAREMRGYSGCETNEWDKLQVNKNYNLYYGLGHRRAHQSKNNSTHAMTTYVSLVKKN